MLIRMYRFLLYSIMFHVHQCKSDPHLCHFVILTNAYTSYDSNLINMHVVLDSTVIIPIWSHICSVLLRSATRVDWVGLKVCPDFNLLEKYQEPNPVRTVNPNLRPTHGFFTQSRFNSGWPRIEIELDGFYIINKRTQFVFLWRHMILSSTYR